MADPRLPSSAPVRSVAHWPTSPRSKNSATLFCSTLPKARPKAKRSTSRNRAHPKALMRQCRHAILCRYRGRGRLHRDRRCAAQARHEPRRPAGHQPQGDEIRGRRHSRPRAQCFCDLHHQPARRDGLGPARILRPAARKGLRHGGRARQRAVPSLLELEFNVSMRDVTAFVLGGHGDTMVPLDPLFDRRRHPLPDLVAWAGPRKTSSTQSSSAPVTAAQKSSGC